MQARIMEAFYGLYYGDTRLVLCRFFIRFLCLYRPFLYWRIRLEDAEMFYFALIMLFFVPIFFLLYLCIKYSNPYKLVMVFGRKGSGKTTNLVKTAYRYKKHGRTVFSNVVTPYSTLLCADDIKHLADLPPESVVLLDEAGILFDNRDYKKFPPELRDYFKLQRHYRHIVYLYSQTFDVDVKIRTLTDQMFLTRCYFNVFVVSRRILRTLDIVTATAESESRIVDNLTFAPLISVFFGGKPFILTFIPFWVHRFDSYAKDFNN